jgi:hypothetical protein
MTARISVLAFAALLPGVALASPPHQATVYVDCNDLQMPSQQEVAGLTGADNFSQAYDRRTRLMIEIQRLCQQRGGQFQLVIEPSPDQGSDRIARR